MSFVLGLLIISRDTLPELAASRARDTGQSVAIQALAPPHYRSHRDARHPNHNIRAMLTHQLVDLGGKSGSSRLQSLDRARLKKRRRASCPGGPTAPNKCVRSTRQHFHRREGGMRVPRLAILEPVLAAAYASSHVRNHPNSLADRRGRSEWR